MFINYTMKNVIVQIFMDKKGWEEENRLDAQSEQVLFLSNVLVKHYAKKINSDYKLITKPIINFKHPTWERFHRIINGFSCLLSPHFGHIAY